MTREERHIAVLRRLLENMDVYDSVQPTEERKKAIKAAIQALSQVSEIEENIIKYMKKYPNHVGNIDFWEGFYACRNVVLQLDDEEYSPKEQEPCDDAISRKEALNCINDTWGDYFILNELFERISKLPSVTQKSVLEQIRAEIIKQFEGCYLEEDMTDERKAEHKAYKNVLKVIDKYRKSEE